MSSRAPKTRDLDQPLRRNFFVIFARLCRKKVKKVIERSQINVNKNLQVPLTRYVFYPQCIAVFFFTAAQNQNGYVSDRLDIDLKASTDTTLSIVQCCWAVYMEMIFFSCQVWQKGFMLPPQGFPLQHQNRALVATGFFIKDSSIVTLQTQTLQWSWVIYRQCQPIFSVFLWMQPLIYTLMHTPSGMCSIFCTPSFNSHKSIGIFK